MQIDSKLIRGLGFAGTNDTWSAVMTVLDEAIAIETATAISRETVGEERVHASGRAEALTEFKADMLQLHDQAKIEMNVTTLKVGAKGG